MLASLKKSFLQFIDDEIVRVSSTSEKTRVTLSHSLSGYSVAGDMFHAKNAQGMIDQYLKRLKDVRKEIEKASEVISERIEPVCFVKISYDDGNLLDFYYVTSAISLPGMLTISKDSPLGKAIFGKKIKQPFEYFLEQEGTKKKFRGLILNIS